MEGTAETGAGPGTGAETASNHRGLPRARPAAPAGGGSTATPGAAVHRMTYLPGLDGVRALAVALVVASHALGRLFHSAGVLGVDLFFVLSGFLITGLLLDEHDLTGRVGLRRFYARRALRLLPALALLLVLVAALPWFYDPAFFYSKWTSIAAAALYVANFFDAANPGGMGNLAQTWSLGVEEQFYLLWPLALLVLLRFRLVARGLVALILAFMALRAGLVLAGTGALALPSSHADQLLIGALLAVAWRQGLVHRAWYAPAIGWLSLLGLAGLLFVVQGSSPEQLMLYQYTVDALLAALLIGHLATRPTGLVGRVATLGPVVHIGRVSYGIYLFHLPIIREVNHYFAERALLGAKWGLVRLGLEAVLVAAAVSLSWRFVERPLAARRQALRAAAPVSSLASG